MKNLKRSQIAGSNYHYIKFSLDYFLDSMEKLNVSQIEFYAASPHFSIEDQTWDSAVKIQKRILSQGLSVCCFTQEQCYYPINIACEDKTIRDRSLETFFKTIEFSELFGAPCAQVIAGRGYFDNPESDAWKRSVESMHKIVEKASKHNVIMVLEAASYNTTNVVYNTKLIRKMIDEIKSSFLKGMLDTCAVNQIGEELDFKQCLQLLGKDMRHLHFADGNPGGHLLPGEGYLPLTEYLHILDEFGYQYAIPFEIYNRIYDFKPHDHMKVCLDFLRRHIPE